MFSIPLEPVGLIIRVSNLQETSYFVDAPNLAWLLAPNFHMLPFSAIVVTNETFGLVLKLSVSKSFSKSWGFLGVLIEDEHLQKKKEKRKR